MAASLPVDPQRAAPFSQSDLVRGRDRDLCCDGAGRWKTPYSRFQAGGSVTRRGRGPHDLTQVLFETAAHWRGVSWQQEYHSKRIRDQRSGLTRRLDGGYIQIGSFLNGGGAVGPRHSSLRVACRLLIRITV